MNQRRARRERHARAAPGPRSSSRSVWLKLAAAAAAAVVIGGGTAAFALTGGGGSGGTEAAATPAASFIASGHSSEGPVALRGTDPVTGKSVSLAAYRGRPIVLNVWASWCTGCAAEARALGTFERAHPEAQVIGIDIQDSKSGARAFYRRFGWRHPSIYDPSGKLAAQLGLQGLPTTFFLERRHRIVARIVGETDVAGFTAGLRQALA